MKQPPPRLLTAPSPRSQPPPQADSPASLTTGPAPSVVPGSRKPKRFKKPIKSNVNVHDRSQIETVFDYYLNRGSAGAPQGGAIKYKVEAFLFYPRQFGLDPITYPKERFYADIRPLIRFREPRLSYKQLLGLKSKIKSPLLFLRSYIDGLVAGVAPVAEQSAIDEVRIFACSFISRYLKDIDRRRKQYAALNSPHGTGAGPETADLLLARTRRVLEEADEVIAAYRRLVTDAAALPAGVAEDLKRELTYIDEYCYYRLRDGVAYLLQLSKSLRATTHSAEAAALMTGVHELLAAHDAHARASGYIVMAPDSPLALKELFLYRRGELKRRIWAVLFLEARTEPLFAFQRQTGAMIGAGLAAVWAIISQLIFVKEAVKSNSLMDFVGFGGLIFLSTAVFAYVVKDRIKEIGRSYFRSGLFRRIPDHSERIFYRPGTGGKLAIGHIRETTRYQTLANLPPVITALRRSVAASGAVESPSVDGVLHYTKVITLSPHIMILGRYSLRAVHDILRLNIDAGLPRLGEPVRHLEVVDDAGAVHAVSFPKVYYMDLALRYSRLDESNKMKEQSSDYFRLVVDKTGLLRVERLG